MTIATVHRRWLTVVSAVVAPLVYCVLLLSVVLTAPAGPFTTLRTAFWHDQLGYLSIVTDVASGNLSQREPMTETGISHYPRNYYSAVGLVARVLGWEPVTAWNVVSIVIQLSAVTLLAIAMSVLARRWWVGLLAPLPFLTGTLSVFRSGTWYMPLEHHAVLWGPYGVLFSNNAETAGLGVIIIVLSMLALVWARPARTATRVTTSIVSAAALGMLSGFQTYSFLTGMYIVGAIIAVYFLRGASWWWTAASGAGLVIVVLGGPRVAEVGGQLPTLVFGLLPALPGLIRGIIRSRGMLALYGAVAAATAVPQIAWTVSGILGGDPFLLYRVDSNTNLGVTYSATVLSSLPVALPLLVTLAYAWRRGHRLAFAAVVGAAVTWALLSVNDKWGANAEPYRFWIDLFLLCGVVVALAASLLLRPSEQPVPVRARPIRGIRVAGLIAVAACAAVFALSLADLRAFSTDSMMQDTWNPSSSREEAIGAAGHAATDIDGEALVVTDKCIDPRTTKIVTAAPIAYFYLGMAWPEQVDAVSEIMTGRLDDQLPSSAIEISRTRWLLTDSACSTTPTIPGGFVPERTFSYDDPAGSGAITLWEIPQG